MKLKTIGLVRMWAPLLWMSGIFLLSSVPDHGTPATAIESVFHWVIPEVQNLLHIPLFGGLCLCWVWALNGFELRFKISAMIAFMLTVAFGGFDEWYQLSVPGRFGSLTDLLLNTLGAALAVYISRRHNIAAKPINRAQAAEK